MMHTIQRKGGAVRVQEERNGLEQDVYSNKEVSRTVLVSQLKKKNTKENLSVFDKFLNQKYNKIVDNIPAEWYIIIKSKVKIVSG